MLMGCWLCCRFAQADPEKDALRVVTEQDWHQLLLYYSGLPALEALTSPQQPEGATATAGRRGGKGNRSSAKQQQQQEQLEYLLQVVASAAVDNPAFNGIKATLRVQPNETANSQPPADRQETAFDGNSMQEQSPAEQQQQQDGATAVNEQQQSPEQQQLCLVQSCEQADHGDGNALTLQQLPQQVASVDLTVQSSTAGQQQTAAAEGLHDVQMIQRQLLDAIVPAKISECLSLKQQTTEVSRFDVLTVCRWTVSRQRILLIDDLFSLTICYLPNSANIRSGATHALLNCTLVLPPVVPCSC